MITYIYLLELKNNQIYIGKTKEPIYRKRNHRVKYGKQTNLKGILNVLSGRAKTAGKYYFKYKKHDN